MSWESLDRELLEPSGRKEGLNWGPGRCWGSQPVGQLQALRTVLWGWGGAWALRVGLAGDQVSQKMATVVVIGSCWRFSWHLIAERGVPGGSEVKVSACNAGDLGSIPGLGRSPGERNGNPLQYPCLENPMDGGAWRAAVHGVAESQARLSDFTIVEKWVLSLCTWLRLYTAETSTTL